MRSDFNELLSTCDAHGVDDLVAGAHALAAHGLIRATKNLEVFVRPEANNAPRVLRALAAFSAPPQDLSEPDLQTPGVIFQIGVPPVRIDVLTAIDGVGFDEAWQARVTAKLGEVEVPVLSRQHLIASKIKAGRKQDLADVEWLEQNGD